MEEFDNLQIVGAEVYAVLQSIPKKEYYKVPKKITSLFEKYKDYKIDTKIDFNKSFEEQKLNKQTKDIIFAISLNYWLTDEERKKTIEKMKANEMEINEKYDVEKLFEQKKRNNVDTQQKNINENKEVVVCEEKWYVKIFNKIKRFFRLGRRL